MKLRKISELQENDVVGKTVMTNDYQILLSEGTVLKQSYISKLKDLNIKEIYVHTPKDDMRDSTVIRQEIRESMETRLEKLVGQYIHGQDESLKKVAEMASEIVEELLTNENLLDRVYNIQEKSVNLYEHSLNVSIYVTITALKMNYKKEQVRHLAEAALLHDLGLQKMSFNICEVDVFGLSFGEEQEYKKHPLYSYEAVKEEDWLSEETKLLILKHHERNDGTGFPLHVDKITELSSILNICELFDEMMSGIGCKPTKVYEAIELIKFYSEKYFSKTVVDVFLQFIAIFPVGSKVVLDNGKEATVVKQNNGFPERPIISVPTEDGKGTEICDLMKIKTLNIVKVLSE